jgi:hypothetical protein
MGRLLQLQSEVHYPLVAQTTLDRIPVEQTALTYTLVKWEALGCTGLHADKQATKCLNKFGVQ